MKKTYIISSLIILLGLLGYKFYQKQTAEKHQKLFSACTEKLQELRRESERIQRVNLYPMQKNAKWGYKDRTGKVIIPPQFDRVEQFSEGRAKVLDRNWFQGFINAQGKF